MWLELPELPASICAQRPWVRLMKIPCGDSFSFLTRSPHPSSPKKWDINQPLGVEQSLHLASWCSRCALHCHFLEGISLYWAAEEKQWCDAVNGIHYPHLFIQPSRIQWSGPSWGWYWVQKSQRYHCNLKTSSYWWMLSWTLTFLRK